MEKRNYPFLNAGSTTVVVLLASLVQAIDPPSWPPSQDDVVVTGWLHVQDFTMADVLLEVELKGTVYPARVMESGRFTVTLPAGTEAILRFEKPGHLTKEVLVDTHFARIGDPGAKTRKVQFAVILELERHMGGLTYAGPVGTISFDQGGGCMAVAHDRNKVPAQRHAPMVF